MKISIESLMFVLPAGSCIQVNLILAKAQFQP